VGHFLYFRTWDIWIEWMYRCFRLALSRTCVSVHPKQAEGGASHISTNLSVGNCDSEDKGCTANDILTELPAFGCMSGPHEHLGERPLRREIVSGEM
jgi:hypothetical protein